MGYRERILADGPVALWMLNETTGTSAVDATGNGRTATYTGTYTLGAATLLPGSTALSLGLAANGYASAADAAAFSAGAGASGTFSVEFLGQCTVNGGMAIAKYAASQYEFYVSFNGDGSLAFVTIQLGGTTLKSLGTAAGVTTPGQRFHCVCTYDRATPTQDIWINGVQVATSSTGFVGNMGDGTSPMFLGYSGISTDGVKWDGRLGAMAYYSTVLSSSQIAAHYRESLREGVVGGGYG